MGWEFWRRTTPIANLEASDSRMNEIVKSGVAKRGASIINYLILSNASWASWCHWKLSFHGRVVNSTTTVAKPLINLR